MNKLIITLFIIWIVWKVIRSVIEELQARMKQQMPQMPERPAARPPVSPASRAQTAGEPDEFEFDDAAFEEEDSDLERWFSEAMERKRQIDEVDDAIPLPVSERARPKPPRPTAQPEAVTRRSEPRVERRHEVRVAHRRVAQPREPVAVQPPPKRPERAVAAAQRAEKPARRPRRRERHAIPELAGIGKLDKRDIRRGIILAELLGTPKALRDIDSHVI